jgi:outer membrane protein OmpA-like peptidoglycan-associated protein
MVVSSEPARVWPESQISRTTHTAVILDPIGELPGSGSELLATGDATTIRLNAIAWDKDPARCIAVVNDKIVHEGDFLGELRVLHINPDHIVLIHGNEHIIKSIYTREEDPSPESKAAQPTAEEHKNEVSELGSQSSAERSIPARTSSSIINFDYNTSELQHPAHEELDRVVSLAKQSPNHAILILGYTDDVGSYEYNHWLSKSRAKIVGGYLVEKEIDPERITAIGMGEKNPLTSNTTPEGRATNRRVEIKLIPVEEDADLLPGG